jgi:hypothetical protein
MSCISVRKPRQNKNGEDPTQILMDAHGIKAETWGWILNEINAYVLLEDGFPDLLKTRTFINDRLLVHFPVQTDHSELSKKV